MNMDVKRFEKEFHDKQDTITKHAGWRIRDPSIIIKELSTTLRLTLKVRETLY